MFDYQTESNASSREHKEAQSIMNLSNRMQAQIADEMEPFAKRLFKNNPELDGLSIKTGQPVLEGRSLRLSIEINASVLPAQAEPAQKQ